MQWVEEDVVVERHREARDHERKGTLLSKPRAPVVPCASLGRVCRRVPEELHELGARDPFDVVLELEPQEGLLPEPPGVDVNQDLEQGKAGVAGGVQDGVAPVVPPRSALKSTGAVERVETGLRGVSGGMIEDAPSQHSVHPVLDLREGVLDALVTADARQEVDGALTVEADDGGRDPVGCFLFAVQDARGFL